ncbi:MAG: protein translocase subunit SecD [Candidatus Promineifilaceae bacterium]
MRQRDLALLALIALLVAAALWMVANPAYPLQRGLDLQGGLQVLLAADVPAERQVEPGDLDTARQIISERVNALGVAEPLVQVEGDRRILVELPGVGDPQQAISLIQETALLEFVDTGQESLPPGLCVRTSLNDGLSRCEEGEGQEGLPDPPTYETIMTGSGLQSASATSDQFNQYFVSFELTEGAADRFEAYTREHLGEFLTIVLDKQVVSSPQINGVIREAGEISGQFTLEEAQQLALQLRYGSLPIPLRIESTRLIGATLGEASVAASIEAGVIGVSIVLLFMLVYYRLPGALADIALVVYALLNIAVFKWLAVTLTLPAITGFLLSTGIAVDANILVFERIKEELRHGRTLGDAIELGFERAWTSIRDANIATLVICFILWFFGRSFGASMVQGFALTLAIGVTLSMFTAVTVTRSLVRLTLGRAEGWLRGRRWLLAT